MRKTNNTPSGNKKAKKTTFLTYAFAEVEHQKSGGHFGVSRNYASATHRLQDYLTTLGKRDLSFKKLTPQLLVSFEQWLQQQGAKRNTTSAYMRSLHAIFNRAVLDGLAEGNPFASVYCGVAKTRKRAIQKQDIRRLQQLDIPKKLTALYTAKKKRTHGKYFDHVVQSLQFYRDLFLFSFAMRGMAFVDVAYLRKSDIRCGTVYYARRKTGQQLDVRIEPMAQQIIDRWTDKASPYVFPIITDTDDDAQAYQQYCNGLVLFNRYLRMLGEMLGGLPLTSYVSRHSWASTAYAAHVPLPIISQSMGHESEHTTRIYLQELDSQSINRANSHILDSVFGTKKKKNQEK